MTYQEHNDTSTHQAETADEEYQRLIDSGVRTPEVVDRIAYLVGGNALVGLLHDSR